MTEMTYTSVAVVW